MLLFCVFICQQMLESPSIQCACSKAYHWNDVSNLVDVLVSVHDVGCELWHASVAHNGHDEKGRTRFCL